MRKNERKNIVTGDSASMRKGLKAFRISPTTSTKKMYPAIFFHQIFVELGFCFGSLFFDPLYLKKKEPHLFFRLKGYLKNGWVNAGFNDFPHISTFRKRVENITKIPSGLYYCKPLKNNNTRAKNRLIFRACLVSAELALSRLVTKWVELQEI